MSRTYKDRPSKIRFPESAWNHRYDEIPYVGYGRYWSNGEWIEREYKGIWFRKKPGILTKKKKCVDTKDHWMSTPSWWTRLYMNRPQRIASKRWEREIVNYSLWDLAQDNFDPPLIGNKPHVYYH